MYVPSDSFGGLSPEQKAANHLRALFTFVACKVILAQLEGSGRGSLGSYNASAYELLSNQLLSGGASAISKDPDAFVEGLLDKDPALARRLLEVRDAYCADSFEWDQLQRLAIKDTKAANLRLMRKAATASLHASLATAAAPSAVGVEQASAGGQEGGLGQRREEGRGEQLEGGSGGSA